MTFWDETSYPAGILPGYNYIIRRSNGMLIFKPAGRDVSSEWKDKTL
jgi:hypothetical protein